MNRLLALFRQQTRRLHTDERGQLLVLTLIATVLGSLVISGLVVYASTSLLLTSDTGERVLERYTADAGVEEVMADLALGIDVLSVGTFTVPLNSDRDGNPYTATVIVSDITDVTTVASQYRYLDPGISYLSPSSLLTYTLNTETGTDIYVNMPFAPDAEWKIVLFQGIQNPVNCDSGSGEVDSGSISPARFVAQPAPGSGPHTLVFCNTSSSTTITPTTYDDEGDLAGAWIWANAHRDFAITSTVGNLTLLVNARQMPGTDINPQTIVVTSWHVQR